MGENRRGAAGQHGSKPAPLGRQRRRTDSEYAAMDSMQAAGCHPAADGGGAQAQLAKLRQRNDSVLAPRQATDHQVPAGWTGFRPVYRRFPVHQGRVAARASANKAG